MTRRLAYSLGSGAAVLTLVFALGAIGTHQLLQGMGAPRAIRSHPVPVPPGLRHHGGEIGPLSAEHWTAICRKFYPNQVVPDVSFLIHHLLNWGPDARFAKDTGALAGFTMLEILFDGRAHPLYTPKSPLLYRAPDGRPMLERYGEDGSESHTNQALATFAMMGVQSSRIIRSGGDSASIAELVDAARADFQLQGEVEWTTIALACYAPTPRPWINRWGRPFDFDTIAEHLLAQPYGVGACSGTHLLQALAVMLRVDTEHRLVSDGFRDGIRRYLAGAINRLEAHQRTSGCWTPDWALPLAEPGYEKFDNALFGEERMVQATGHHLEWLDVAPVDLAIDENVWSRAMNWCVAALERAPTIDDKNLCPYSHCFRMARRYASVADRLGGEGRLP